MATYKVIGRGEKNKFFDENSYVDAINYIQNPQKAAYVGGTGVSSINAAPAEMAGVAVLFGKTNGKKLRHSVLSFSNAENVSPERAALFASQIVEHYAPQYQMVYAVHSNTDQIHIHFVMNQISYVDGQRYLGQKKDYYDFMKHMGKVTGLTIIPEK